MGQSVNFEIHKSDEISTKLVTLIVFLPLSATQSCPFFDYTGVSCRPPLDRDAATQELRPLHWILTLSFRFHVNMTELQINFSSKDLIEINK